MRQTVEIHFPDGYKPQVFEDVKDSSMTSGGILTFTTKEGTVIDTNMPWIAKSFSEAKPQRQPEETV